MLEDQSQNRHSDEPRLPQPHFQWRRHFFPMWVGQAFSLVGSRVVQFALVWWLTRETGSATVLATATIVALVPEIVLGPIAGAYVDRWQRKAVMLLADTTIALASLLLAYLFWIGAVQVGHIYGLLFIRALGGSFHWPAMQSSTSLMVPERHLTRIAGANQTLNGVLTIISPPLGALLLELIPMAAILLVDVGTAILAILPLLFVFVPQPIKKVAAAGAQSVWRDVRVGLAYVRGWPGLMALIGVSLLIKLALTPAFTLLPLLVSDYFRGSAADLAVLQAVSGIGMVAGGLLLSAWGGFKRRIYTAMGGVFVLGLGLLLVGLAPADEFFMAVIGGLVIGLTIPLIDGPIIAILQSTV
ncbi:MAG: MFS transporter, partial [Candidatus Promineifilaceae bacterium]|nr:MFS transporter [Candidatus Promineifilaceae bacterium]